MPYDMYDSDIMLAYVCKATGSDVTGDGSERKPYRTILRAVEYLDITEEDPFKRVYTYKDHSWVDVSESELEEAIEKYREQKENQPGEADLNTEQELAEATLIQITMDPSLPEATRCKLKDVVTHTDKRVVVSGWADEIRRCSTKAMYVVLRDGSGYLQCVFLGDLCRIREAILLKTESTLTVYGTVKKVAEGIDVPGDVELLVDYWKLIAASPGVRPERLRYGISETTIALQMSRLEEETSNQLRVLSLVSEAFREHYKSRGYTEVMPPTFAKTCEKMTEHTSDAPCSDSVVHLWQSARLYMERFMPSLGDVYSFTRSFRSDAHFHQMPWENIPRARYFYEYVRVEAQCPFINFDDLLDRVEDLIVDVTTRVMEKAGDLIYKLNSRFELPTKPFRRMHYEEAIRELNRSHHTNNGRPFQFGDDISEDDKMHLARWNHQMVFLTHFPAHLKSSHVLKSANDQRLTDSFELLAPFDCEIADGSMCIENNDEVKDACAKANIDQTYYYWYTDQSRFGSCPHGGYGLKLDQFCSWLLNRNNKYVSLYPRPDCH